MNEYVCNQCGNQWMDDALLEEAECPCCYAMDCFVFDPLFDPDDGEAA